VRTLRHHHFDAGDSSSFKDEADGLGAHFEPESGIAFGMACQKIEKVPLRHKGHEFSAGWKMGEIGHWQLGFANLRLEEAGFLMRRLQEFIEEAKLIHNLERRGMDGVAAKITEKIGVLFENKRIYPGAGKRKPEHHSRGPSANDAAAAGNRLRCLGHGASPFRPKVNIVRAMPFNLDLRGLVFVTRIIREVEATPANEADVRLPTKPMSTLPP
jgi:hypothetical protein